LERGKEKVKRKVVRYHCYVADKKTFFKESASPCPPKEIKIRKKEKTGNGNWERSQETEGGKGTNDGGVETEKKKYITRQDQGYANVSLNKKREERGAQGKLSDKRRRLKKAQGRTKSITV